MIYGKMNKDNSITIISMDEYVTLRTGCSEVTDSIESTIVNTQLGRFAVSTVFVGISWSGNDWFETMVFGPTDEEIQFRCATYEEAVEQHKIAMGMIYQDYDALSECTLNHAQLAYLGERKCALESLPEHEQFHCLML